MLHYHFSQANFFCFGVAFIFAIAIVSYATWKGKHSARRWIALVFGFSSCVAGAFTPDVIAVFTAFGSFFLFLVSDPATDDEAIDEDAPTQTTRMWDSRLSENERIVREYELSRERGIDEQGHLVDPTPEFKKLAEEEQS